MHKNFIIGLLTVWMSVGCNGHLFAAEPIPPTYFPLSVGNRWVYESSEGTPTALALETWKVIRQEGAAFVVQVTQPSMTDNDIEELLTPTTEGLMNLTRTRTDSPARTQTPELILKLPPTAGTSWKNESGRYAITGDSETITVPAGTFSSCIEVTYWAAEGNVKVVTVYAPGVGMVQREEQFPILGGIGDDLEAPTQGRTVLRLKEWKVESPESKVQDQSP